MLRASEIGTSVGEHQREYLYKMAITKDPVLSSMIDDYEAMKGNLDLYNTKGVFPERASADIELKWAGETYHLTGVDESNKKGTLTFRADEARKIRKFWRQLKELNGSETNQAAYPKAKTMFNMSCWMISTDKETVTDAVTLENTQVLKVGELTPDKEGTGVSTFTVDIVWDRALDEEDSVGTKV